jgi:hypothetical protein
MRAARERGHSALRTERRLNALRPLWLLQAFQAMVLCGWTGCRAEVEVAYPSSIPITREDCRNIVENGTLHGRTVCVKVQIREDVWRGERVFTGRKADILGWLCDTGHLSTVLGGDKGWVGLRTVQYEILCRHLLETRDKEIMSTVIRKYCGLRTGYLVPEWKAAFENDVLAIADRLMAWVRWNDAAEMVTLGRIRARDLEVAAQERINLIWKTLGDVLSAEDIVQACRDAEEVMESQVFLIFKWSGFDRARAGRLLLPIADINYLREGSLVPMAAVRLYRFPEFHEVLLDRLAAFDSAKMPECAKMVSSIDFKTLENELASRLRELVLAANTPELGGIGFWKYLETARGKSECERDGGKQFLEEYLRRAFGRESQEAEAHLRSLTKDLGELMYMLRNRKLDIVVKRREFELLQRAWSRIPDSLKFLIVCDNP